MSKACLCHEWCGDVPEEKDPYGVCKGLRREPKPPLVEIVLVHRRTALTEIRHTEDR